MTITELIKQLQSHANKNPNYDVVIERPTINDDYDAMAFEVHGVGNGWEPSNVISIVPGDGIIN